MTTTITVTDLGEGNTRLAINPIDAKGSKPECYWRPFSQPQSVRVCRA